MNFSVCHVVISSFSVCLLCGIVTGGDVVIYLNASGVCTIAAVYLYEGSAAAGCCVCRRETTAVVILLLHP